MRMNKKKVLSLSLVVIMIAILSFSSLAWFSDADEITNEFMIADSESEPDEIFSVDVWEDVNEDGQPDQDQDGHTYENILPGGRYYKQPYVENTGAYDQYIRVKVTVTNADAWIAALGNDYDLGTMFEGHDETLWTRYEPGVYDGTANTYTMTFYLNKILEPDASEYLFTHVVIPGELTQNDMVFVGGKFDLKIVAEAVQTENLGDSVVDAYTAFQVLDASGQEIDQIQNP